jgi:predicted RNA-binding protein YlxR (DUF448 family)
MCVGCRRVQDPQRLVRISRAPEGALRVGPGSGRGAWLCGESRTATCFDQAVRRRALGRALRSELTKLELEDLRAKLLETERAQELANE